MDSVRMDKWLWAARFYKTRALAAKACDIGRVSSNGHEAKPARDVHVGDMLVVRNEGGEFVVEVTALSGVRGSATVAAGMFRETEESRTARARVTEERKALNILEAMDPGRPSKRDRREINRFRGR